MVVFCPDMHSPSVLTCIRPLKVLIGATFRTRSTQDRSALSRNPEPFGWSSPKPPPAPPFFPQLGNQVAWLFLDLPALRMPTFRLSYLVSRQDADSTTLPRSRRKHEPRLERAATHHRTRRR